MKSLKYAGIALCSMLTMVSCSEEQIVSNNSQQIEGNYTVEVSRLLESRTWLPEEPVSGEYPTYWSTDDRIEVSSGDRKVRGKLSLYEGGNTENAKFKGLVNGAHSKLEYAVYPLPNSKGEIELTSRSYSNPNAPMIGTFGADKSRVNFENTCGMFRLVINNYPADKNLIVTGNGISGKAKPVKNGDKWDLQWTTDGKDQVTITDTPSEMGRVVFYVPVITDQVLTDQGASGIKPTTITVAVAETDATITKDLKIAKKVVSALESSTFLTLTYIPEEDGRAAQLIEAWDGNADTSWYNETDTEFTLSKASELAGLAKLVNEKDENGERITFEGKTIKLGASINLDGELWTPVGHYSWKDSEQMYFEGTFDGQGYTISNLLVDSENAGLFECTWGATIKNLNIENAVIVGSENAGAIVACVRANANKAQAYTTIEDVTIENYTVNGEENGPLFGMMTGWAGVRVIENGETTEYTLSSELNAKLAAGGTVTLEDDFVCSNIEPLFVPEGVTVTLNLNGKTISNANGYAIENEGDLTISDDGQGGISGLGGIRSKGGEVTINGGTYTGSSDWNEGTYQHVLKAENTEVTINGGTFDATIGGITNAMINVSNGSKVTINGGEFRNVGEGETIPTFAPYMFTYEGDGKLIIKNGKFYGGWRFNGTTATTDIYGGYFTVSYDGQSFHANSTHELNVYGGTFSLADGGKLNPTSYVADGYKVIKTDVDGKEYYSVVLENETYENPIVSAEQLKALGNTSVSGTYNLLADINMEGIDMQPIMLASGANNSLVFNGNGHTIKNLNLVKAYQNGMYVASLFNIMHSGKEVTVKDLTIVNATSVSDKYAGVVVAYNSTTTTTINLDNVDVDGATIQAETVSPFVSYTTGPVNLIDCNVKNITMTGEKPEKIGAFVGTANQESCVVTATNCKNETEYKAAGRVIYGATLEIDGEYYVTSSGAINKALAKGAETIILPAGEYSADFGDATSRTLTIIGTKETVIRFENQGGNNALSLEKFDNLTIRDCKIGRMFTKNWGMLVFGTSKNAEGVYTIENCTFEGEGTQGIYINETVSGATYNIIDCTFNGDFGGEGAITIQCNDNVNHTVNVNGCTFNEIPETSNKLYIIYHKNKDNEWTLNTDITPDDINWRVNP